MILSGATPLLLECSMLINFRGAIIVKQGICVLSWCSRLRERAEMIEGIKLRVRVEQQKFSHREGSEESEETF